MRHSLLSLVIFSTHLVACLGGTSSRPAGARCDEDGQCEEGLLCVYGRCRPECRIDGDCGEGQVCLRDSSGATVCTVEDEGSSGSGDCPAGLGRARDGEPCRPLCGDTSPCAPGTTCQEGVCVPFVPRVAPADVTGDGVDDLVVVANQGCGTLYVFEGEPVFAPADTSHAWAAVAGDTTCCFSEHHMTIADVDGDGASDVVVACQERGVALLVGPLPHQLGVAADHPILDIPSPTGDLRVGDLDGDGRADLVTTNKSEEGQVDGVARVYLRMAELAPSPTEDILIAGTLPEAEFGGRVAVGDVTGDGVHDLVVGAWERELNGLGAVYLFPGPLSPGTYGEGDAATHITGRVTHGLFGVGLAVWDSDQDGEEDLLVGADEDRASGTIYVFNGPLRGGSLTTDEADHFITSGGNELGTSLRSEGDMDGDGWVDLVALDCYYDRIGQLVGVYSAPDLAEHDSDQIDFSLDAETRISSYAVVGDVNADGRHDLAVGVDLHDDSAGAVYLYFGGAIGSGTVSAMASHTIEGQPAQGLGAVVPVR